MHGTVASIDKQLILIIGLRFMLIFFLYFYDFEYTHELIAFN